MSMQILKIKLKEEYMLKSKLNEMKSYEEDYPDLLSYETEVYNFIDDKDEQQRLKDEGYGRLVSLLTMDELYPWVEEIVENQIQDSYNEQQEADYCFDEICKKIQKVLLQRAKHKEIQNKANEIYGNSLKESKLNESDDTEYTDGTLVNQLEFEVKFIYNELKDWLKSFKDTEFSVYKGIGGTENLPEYYIKIMDREDDVARELLFYEDEGDIYLKMWYGSSIRKSEHAKTYQLSTIKNIPEFCKDIIMDIRSHKILYPKTRGYIKPNVEESVKILKKAGYLVESKKQTVKKYKKKPVQIEAIKWTGDNFNDVKDFAGTNVKLEDNELIITTLEDGKTGKAKHIASKGDFVIKGVQGEFYFCKPDIFKETYDEV